MTKADCREEAQKDAKRVSPRLKFRRSTRTSVCARCDFWRLYFSQKVPAHNVGNVLHGVPQEGRSPKNLQRRPLCRAKVVRHSPASSRFTGDSIGGGRSDSHGAGRSFDQAGQHDERADDRRVNHCFAGRLHRPPPRTRTSRVDVEVHGNSDAACEASPGRRRISVLHAGKRHHDAADGSSGERTGVVGVMTASRQHSRCGRNSLPDGQVRERRDAVTGRRKKWRRCPTHIRRHHPRG